MAPCARVSARGTAMMPWHRGCCSRSWSTRNAAAGALVRCQEAGSGCAGRPYAVVGGDQVGGSRSALGIGLIAPESNYDCSVLIRRGDCCMARARARGPNPCSPGHWPRHHGLQTGDTARKFWLHGSGCVRGLLLCCAVLCLQLSGYAKRCCCVRAQAVCAWFA